MAVQKFCIRVPQGANNVTVVGSWDNWKTQKPLQNDGDAWQVETVIESHQVVEFKFVVDGEWKTSSEYQVKQNGIGGWNNWTQLTDDIVQDHVESQKQQVEQDILPETNMPAVNVGHEQDLENTTIASSVITNSDSQIEAVYDEIDQKGSEANLQNASFATIISTEGTSTESTKAMSNKHDKAAENKENPFKSICVVC